MVYDNSQQMWINAQRSIQDADIQFNFDNNISEKNNHASFSGLPSQYSFVTGVNNGMAVDLPGGTSNIFKVAIYESNQQLSTAKFSYSVWAKVFSPNINGMIYVSSSSAGSIHDTYAMQWVELCYESNFIFNALYSKGTWRGTKIEVKNVNTEEWIHISCVYDGITKHCYFNGVHVGDVVATGGEQSLFNEMQLNNYSQHVQYDNFRIYYRLLTPEEIRYIYESKA